MSIDKRTHSSPGTYLTKPTSRALEWNKIYIGKVKNNVDARRMGRLQVWIPELCTEIEEAYEDNENTWVTVNYAPIFGGATNIHDSSNENTFSGTQKSYGMTFVPPDLNVQVGIFFANGDAARGYWFCCIMDQQMNHPIPGIAAADDKQIPRRDTNRKAKLAGQDSEKPSDEPLETALNTQGLLTDELRGAGLSTMRRTGDHGQETTERSPSHIYKPAKVYGLLSPGGHQMVIDDGFDNEQGGKENSIIRFRTRNGSQILIDDTTGFVYFVTRNGKTWLEITDKAGGHVDVYATNSVSVHAQDGDINLKAGNNIHIEAGHSIYVSAGDDIMFQAGESFQTRSGDKTIFEAGADMNLKTDAIMKQESGSTFNVRAGGNYLETASQIHMNGPAAATSELAATPLPPKRVPEHEPWAPHTYRSGGGSSQPSNSRAPYSHPDDNFDPEDIEVEPFDGILDGNICGMNEDETRTYLGVVGQSESGGKYNTVNTLNYVGKYQMGAAALEDTGYLKKGSTAREGQAALNNPNNWTGVNGINSKQDFLASGNVQESQMIRYSNLNCNNIQRGGGNINMLDLPVADRAGLLMAAHLGGPGGAKALWNDGVARSDDYGTSTGKYFRRGKGAFTSEQDI